MTTPTMLSLEDMESLADTTPQGEGTPPEQPKPESQQPTAQPAGAPTDDPRISALQRALDISEHARVEMLQQMRGGQAAPQIEQPKWYTREELMEMMDSDDKEVRFQALEISNRQATAQAKQYFDAQFGTLASSMVGTAEMTARQKYATEFELFGPQIQALTNGIQDKNQLTSMAAWDNLVAYVRGLPGNFEKLVTHYVQRPGQTGTAGTPPATPPAEVFSGPTFVPQRATTGAQNESVVVDDVTKEIAYNLGYTSVEAYLKDRKLTEKFTL